eukprot:CAMPEP_0172303310 /NCGR_PEP_ID=MMETSP1058-20130122/4857_1 /TAXON_ID=83371 /ORGANISM="Detonula confervacea, Strain CCMP 353" /LENGTH=263 /DNA_ID=CAMNT_0013014061 /DNA_START=109 /DNA_END=900 /DNA_ORIENTATION=+
MPSSEKNMDVIITNNSNHVHEEMVYDDIIAKFASSNQANESKNIGLNGKGGSGTTKAKVKMGFTELMRAPSPSVCSRRISSSSTDLRQDTKPQKEEEDANKNLCAGFGDKNQVSSPAWKQRYPSSIPQGTIVEGASSGEFSITPTSNLSPSRETLTLAQMYHSSRRSRHSPQRSGNNSFIISPKAIPPLPLTSSSSFDSQEIWQEMETAISNTDKEEWSFDIASCSSNSVGSMECEELVSHEAVLASKLFDEREPKRRRTSMK